MVGGAGAGKAAEGIIAKAVKDLFRVAEKDAGEAAARDAERAAAKDAARGVGRDAERDAARRAEREAAARAEARRVCGDPVDAATGEVVLSTVDVDLPGVLPLTLARTHISSYRAGRFFGANWASTLDQRLEVSAGGVRFLGADGMVLSFPRPPGGASVLPNAGAARWELREAGGGRYTLSDPDSGEVRWFARPPDSYAPSLPLVAVTDRSGRHRYDIDHDSAGMPTAVRHSGGYRVGVQSTGGVITGYRLDSGDGVQLTRFGYGGDGRLVAVVDSSGQPMRLGYDADGRLAWWVDRNGTGYRYEYDERGRCVAAGGPSGHLGARFDYGDGNRTAYTNSLGDTTVFELNELGQIVREVDPLGHATTQVWDEYDRLVARTDAVGNTTRWQYDGNGDLAAVIAPGGGRRTAVYNARHQAVTVVGADGARWAAEYDGAGNLVATTDPAGASTRFAFADGRLAGVTDALGRQQRLETDAAGLVTALVEPDGARTTYERDAFGRVVAVTDALGNTTRYGWTVEGRLAWRTMPDGATDRWRYDGEGNQTEHVDPLGQATTTEYAAFDLPAVTTDADGRRSVLAHDGELRLTAVTNGAGQTWSYGYDAAGRLVAETDYRGRTVGFEYDAAGRLVARAGAGGQRTDYRRDAGGAIVELRRHEPDGSAETLTFERDAAGRVVRAGGAGVELSREYDAAGRLVAETTDGRTISFEYDVLGRCVRRTTPAGVDSSWEYGPVHELPLALHTAGQSVRFGYDAIGREVARRLGPDLLLTQEWDASSRLSAIGVSAGLGGTAARQLGRRSYAYRPDGYPSALADLGSGQYDLALDPVGRVREVTGPQWSERYAYDDLGGRADDGRVRYEYDADGRVVVRTELARDGTARTWRQAWNSDDQLTEVTTPDGTRWRYRYDPLGRRVAKQRLDAAGEVAATTTFCWHDYRLVEQTEDRARSTTWEYRPGTYQPIAQTDSRLDQSEVDSRFFAIVTDLVGAPAELVTPAGELAWQQRRTVFGEALPGGARGVDCPLRFPGQYHDDETGLHYNLARHYDPATGRYQSPDPLGLAAGPDPYGYARNPMVWLDPYGLACRTVYRQLSAADREAFDRGEGLVAKGTSRDIAAHIRGEDTRHISASLTREQSERFASGNGLVAIDVDEALRGGARYIDHGNVMQAAGRASDASRLKVFAERAGEVLFIDQIPFSAMRLVE